MHRGAQLVEVSGERSAAAIVVSIAQEDAVVSTDQWLPSHFGRDRFHRGASGVQIPCNQCLFECAPYRQQRLLAPNEVLLQGPQLALIEPSSGHHHTMDVLRRRDVLQRIGAEQNQAGRKPWPDLSPRRPSRVDLHQIFADLQRGSL